MMVLAEKLRKARERRVELGRHTFTVRRPTDLEMLALRERLAAQDVAALLPFVVGWENVTELDLVPGGDAVPAAFSAALCAEWLADRPDLLNPLVEAIIEAYRTHAASLEGAAKN